MSREYFDALFVINASTDLGKIKSIVKNHSWEKILVLSSHYLYPYEKSIISIEQKSFTFCSFLDFLNDEEMISLDQLAHDKALPHNLGFHLRYFSHLNYLKNEKIYKKLTENLLITKIYFEGLSDDRKNLGISGKYWRSINGKPLVGIKYYVSLYSLYKIFRSNYFLTKLINAFNGIKPLELKLLKVSKNLNFVFLSTRRLRFKDGVQFEIIKFSPFQNIFGRYLGYSKLNRFKNFISKNLGNEKYTAVVPLHQFHLYYKYLNSEKVDLQIFQDAYRPSNYPHYYFVNALFHGDLVARDIFDFKLFTSVGRTVFKPHKFLSRTYLKTPPETDEVKNNSFVLSLNHAGDWSSLLNRADTDYLVHEYCQIARKYPEKHFIIRPHPTSIDSRHEGMNAIERIKAFVLDLNLENLEVSSISLEEDWKRGDVFISEYSLSVIDAMQLGKLALFVNLTNRRSFVQDYKDLGFLHADNLKEFENKLQDILNDPVTSYKKQQVAVNNYNKWYKNFLQE